MWNLKRNDTNELIYKTETDSQLFRARTLNLEKELMVAGGRKGERIVRELGTNMDALLSFRMDIQQGSAV